jgi:hypothetical protein
MSSGTLGLQMVDFEPIMVSGAVKGRILGLVRGSGLFVNGH